MKTGIKQMALDAIAQYNAETAAGGEPVYPAWADQVIGLVNAADAAIQCMSELEPTQERIEAFRMLHGALADARGAA
ncbi:hypothetical protein OYT13_16855 [Pandoraea sp. XJJ-1]|uniref:hypothetical protein n=1 Tax=Pandoraea sp. XJJ-1 TaxID=3002643 RepID=UPI00227F72CD|nr:hypothetical protein [Pandoraea sp. XJJ-1]WAL81508.1 hypothetical protein OYT13_16855 [Pandoraea sp. XJJ-1]